MEASCARWLEQKDYGMQLRKLFAHAAQEPREKEKRVRVHTHMQNSGVVTVEESLCIWQQKRLFASALSR